MHGTEDHMPGLLDKLSEYEIAGCFEDPLPGEDIDAYIELRQRSRLPVVLQPLPDKRPPSRSCADPPTPTCWAITISARPCAAPACSPPSGSPFMLQNTGSDITRAMNVHMMAAFPSATFHSVNSHHRGVERAFRSPNP